MATGSDIRDILSLPQQQQRGGGGGASMGQTSAAGASFAQSHPSQSQLQRGNRSRKKPKMDGISRELYALLGDNTPSLTFSHVGTGDKTGKFMPKMKKRPQKITSWRHVPFETPARTDSLTLRHWRPAHDDGNNVEEASQHHKASSGVYTYSNDEYHQHLRDDDWTKEETDYLIALCERFDLRFVIIVDRYEWEGKERSMEDLKARYYAICRRLIRSRISTDDTEARSQLILTYSFDRAREVERKKHVARLFSRTPQQLAEEEALYIEARRLEQNEAKFATEREELLRLLGGWERVPNIQSDSVAAAGSGVSLTQETMDDLADPLKRSKKRKVDGEEQSHSVGASVTTKSQINPTPLSAKQRAELKNAQFDEVHNITRFDAQSTIAQSAKPPYPYLTGTPSTYPPVAPSLNNPSSSHGVFLRSTRILTPKANLLQRTQEAMAELQPPVSLRICFPTKKNCEKWEGVVGALTSGLEMKRQLDRVQSEIRIMHLRSIGKKHNTEQLPITTTQADERSSKTGAQTSTSESSVVESVAQ